MANSELEKLESGLHALGLKNIVFSEGRLPSLRLPDDGIKLENLGCFVENILIDGLGYGGAKNTLEPFFNKIPNINSVYLTCFKVDLGNNGGGAAFFVGFQLRDALNIISDSGLPNIPALVISDPGFTIGSLGCDAGYKVDVYGTLEIFGVALKVEVQWPAMIITGTLVGELDLQKLLAEAGFAEHVTFGDESAGLKIRAMMLRMDLNNKAFDFTFGMSGWQILPDDKLTLNNLLLDLSTSQEHKSAGVRAQMTVCGIGIDLSGRFQDGQTVFSGSTTESIHIAKLMADLAHIFGITSSTPDPISDVTINQLAISFNTGTKNFTFTLETKFPVDGQELDMVLIVKIERQQDNSYTKHFSVKLTLNGLEFDVIFDSKPDATIFIATYSDPLLHPISVHDLVATIYPGNPLPSSLTFAIKDALLSYQGQAGAMPASKYLFGLALDISAKGSFRELPLVGPELPETVGIEGLRILVATQPFETSDVTAINGLLPPNVTQLPLGSSEADQARDQGSADKQTQQQTTEHQPPPALARGITLSASLKFGEESYPLLLAPSSNASSANGGKEDENQPQESRSTILRASAGDEGALSATPGKEDSLDVSPSVKWIKIEKCLGPLYFKRAGLQYQSQNQELGFLLDAALSVGGLTLSLDGLGCHSPINRFAPTFELHGLGIYFKRDQLEIGGAFLKMPDDEYGGTAIFKTDTLSLSAIGLYKAGDQPSMFVYAFLDYPLGGPPFFYVTGLAAGFGYNRLLVMPPIDQVAQYPLVAAVCEKPADGKPVDPSTELQNLCEVVPVQRGQYLLAAGVKFTSFKMINSFALLAVSFGEHLEVDILGISTIKIPFSEEEKTDSLAEIWIAFKASFIPADGFLGVMAQLTSASYILSKDCHLTGGIAFYSWFSGDQAGDFVLTVGGYHSDFKVPAHYPQVPRLAINWQVSSELSVKGDAYFALTPSALMAGGHLEATWQSGPIKAWFIAGADFLIAWKPFHYDAEIYVNMGVSYTFWFFGTRHITVELGADLHIWGPEFSGVAHIHLWCVSFSVSFGAGADPIPEAIEWGDFEASFLPKEILSVSVKNGLVSASSPSEAKIINLGVINPKDFSLAVDSVIPVKTVNDRVPTHHEDGPEYRTSFGIAPMNITDLRTSNLKIMLNGIVSNEFTFTPITKNVPAGLWGTKFQPDLNSEQLVENVVCGFEITPAEKPKAGGTAAIDPLKLQDQLPTLRELHMDWEKELLFSTDKSKADQVHDHTRRQAIQDSLTKPNTTRQKMLTDLGLGNEKITIDPKIADIFIIAPQIEAASM